MILIRSMKLIIPKNYNTKDTLKKETNSNIAIDIVESANANNIYEDSAIST